MRIDEFFRLVLPEQGNTVLFVSQLMEEGTRGWNENYSDLASMGRAALSHDTALDKTVYFAIGSFKDNIDLTPSGRMVTRRRQSMAHKFKTLAIDIDVGEKHVYQTAKDGAAALLAACDKIALPRPMLVQSGRGVHAYWPFTQEIDALRWEKLSRMLAAALNACNVDYDTGKVFDCSMVLRPVGTSHKKDPDNWKPVKVVMPCEARDVMEYAKALLPYKSYAAVANVAPAAPKRTSAMMDAILEYESTPVILESLRGCAQISAILDSQGATDASGSAVEEPLWRATLGIAKYCEDTDAAIIAMAGGHPDFDMNASKQKLEGWQGTGPTTCSKLDDLCPNVCGSCPHQGKFKSPAALSQGRTEMVTEHPETGEEIQLVLPPNYHIKGGALMYRGRNDDDDRLVSPYPMWVVGRVSDVEEERQTVKVAVDYPRDGMRVIDIDIEAAVGTDSVLNKALALKQIYRTGDGSLLRNYFMSYLRELQKASSIDYYYRHYGWQKDGTFLTGQGVVGRDDVEHIHFDGPVAQYHEFMQPKGDLARWSAGTKLFAHDDLKFHGGYFLMMLGAPLMVGSNIPGVFVNAYSRDSGSGKTLTARFGLSAWGEPSRLMRNVNDTDNALYKHLGLLNSFGAYIDEVTTMDDDRLRNVVFSIQEGREKERVTQSADGFRHKNYWNMPVFSSSNRDLHELLGMRMSSEAEQLRVVQLPFPRTKVFEDSSELGYKLSHFLEGNHGLAGPVLVAEIIKRGGPKDIFDKAYRSFSDKYDFKFLGQERFANAVIVCADAIGEIATDLDLIQFDYKKSVRNLLEAVKIQRGQMEETKQDSLDILFLFLNHYADQIVHWRQSTDDSGQLRSYALEPPRKAVARTEYAHDAQGRLQGGTLHIQTKALRKWCQVNGAEYTSTIDGLTKLGVSFNNQQRSSLFKGVQGSSSTGQVYSTVIEVMSNPRLIAAAEASEVTPISFKPRLEAVK